MTHSTQKIDTKHRAWAGAQAACLRQHETCFETASQPTYLVRLPAHSAHCLPPPPSSTKPLTPPTTRQAHTLPPCPSASSAHCLPSTSCRCSLMCCQLLLLYNSVTCLCACVRGCGCVQGTHAMCQCVKDVVRKEVMQSNTPQQTLSLLSPSCALAATSHLSHTSHLSLTLTPFVTCR